jgi:hypothetical protein
MFETKSTGKIMIRNGGRKQYPAGQPLRSCCTIGIVEEVKKGPSTWHQPIVIWHQNYSFKLLQYAEFTWCTMLPIRISNKYIMTH